MWVSLVSLQLKTSVFFLKDKLKEAQRQVTKWEKIFSNLVRVYYSESPRTLSIQQRQIPHLTLQRGFGLTYLNPK